MNPSNLSALFQLARAGDHTELTRRRLLVTAANLWHRPGCGTVVTATTAAEPQLTAVLEVLARTNLCACVHEKWNHGVSGREPLRRSADLVMALRLIGDYAVVTTRDERPLDHTVVGTRMLSALVRKRWDPPPPSSSDLLRVMRSVHERAAATFDVARSYQPDDDTLARWSADHDLGHVDVDDRVTLVLAPLPWWRDHLHGRTKSSTTALTRQVGLWWLPQPRVPVRVPVVSVPRGIADALTALRGPEAQVGVALPFELDVATVAALGAPSEPIGTLAELRSHVTRVVAARC